MERRRGSLGNFELMVLLAVMRVEHDAYGLPILNEIQARIGRAVAVGSVYGALARLEAKGFVTSRLGTPTAARGGKAKRYFAVTARGVLEVQATRRALLNLWQGLPDTRDGLDLRSGTRSGGRAAAE